MTDDARVIFQDSLDGITADSLIGFFVGWLRPPSPETHLEILRGSNAVILAIDPETRRVVGFITAITDGVLAAYIPLLEVLPTYQGRGIGSQLVRAMLARLRNLYMIDLLCDAEVQPFYTRLGLIPAEGVCVRHYERQAGLPVPGAEDGNAYR